MKPRTIHTGIMFPIIKEKGPNGKRLCRFCKKEVPGRRRYWCSDDCAISAHVFSGHPWAIDKLLKARDEGICYHCGTDTLALEKALRRRRRVSLEAFRDMRIDLKNRGYDTGIRFWAAHHFIPVKDGGAFLGPRNLVTLCQPCHKKTHSKKIILKTPAAFFPIRTKK